MSKPEWQEAVGRHVVALKIIVAGMTVGPLLFLLASWLLLRPAIAGRDGAGAWFLTSVAMGFGAVTILEWMVIPRLIVASGRRRILRGRFSGREHPVRMLQSSAEDLIARTGDAGRLMQLLLTKTIVGCALLEGATFLLLVAYLAEGHIASLWCAAVLILAVAAHLPTRWGVVAWIEGQLRRLERQR